MKGIREEVIADQLGEVFRSIRLTPEIAALAVKGLREADRNGEQLRASELARLTKRRRTLQRRLDQAFEAFIDGKVVTFTMHVPRARQCGKERPRAADCHAKGTSR